MSRFEAFTWVVILSGCDATGRSFALSIIALSCCASAGYFYQGDLRHGIYWLAGAVLNVCVTI